MAKASKRIGIYAGTFDPVHAGHVAFALQAMEAAQLDAVYFLPERQPRHKQGVEHFAHRVAMLRQAARPHARFGVLDMPDSNFSVKRTLPRLKKRFPKAQLVFLFGSDVVPTILTWPHVDQLLPNIEIVVGLRHHASSAELISVMPPGFELPKVHFVHSYEPSVSSGAIRDALRKREYAKGLLTSVRRYSDHHWLYVSLA